MSDKIPSAAVPAQQQESSMVGNEIITINGRDYVPADSIVPAGENVDMGVCILVLQRGWVVVGHAHRVGPRVVVSKCAVVRRWGTMKGLGELAATGPTSKTVLDDCGIVTCLESEVVMSMRCERAPWASRV